MDYDEYNDELLAAIYDDDNPDGRDHDYYRTLATRLNATRITDLGCGTGILTVTLVAPGRTVTGIDPAAAMLARASSRAQGDAVEWRLGTSNLIDAGENDLVIMTGNVAMQILGKDWHATLKDIARGLKPGGVLAFESRNPQARAWTEWNDPGSERNTGVGRLRERTITTAPNSDGVVTMQCRNEFIDANHVVDVEQDLQFRTFDQITEDLDRADLTVLNVWKDWNGTPFTGSAVEPIMVFEASSRT
ncbi:class I SAM-dependent methyltransferase [Arthrobacter sp. TMN-37]